MRNILLKGGPGTGKTVTARAMAYYLCQGHLDIKDVFAKDFCADADRIAAFCDSGLCEYIQLHPAIGYEDIVYGMEITADKSMTVSNTEKRVKTLCERAAGSDRRYSIIFDDITRTDFGALFGNLLYAMEYRGEPVALADGQALFIPDNVILIFTAETGAYGAKTEHALLRRMDGVWTLVSDKNVLARYYTGMAKSIACDLFAAVEDFVLKNKDKAAGGGMPGHGMFLVPRAGADDDILNRLKQKLRYQLFPYLYALQRQGVLSGDLRALFAALDSKINTGVCAVQKVAGVRKIMVNSGAPVTPYTLLDTRDYFARVIVPGQCVDHKGILESLIDALLLNGMLPQDMVLSALLFNTHIASVECKDTPGAYASYLVLQRDAPFFYYDTPRAGKRAKHAYYSQKPARTGRWAAKKDTAAYEVTYTAGRAPDIYLPLNGLRAHYFAVDGVHASNNAAELYGAAYRLLDEYLKLYADGIRLAWGGATRDLYRLAVLERAYLAAAGRGIRDYTGDKAKIAYFGKKLLNLRLVWLEKDGAVFVDEKKFACLWRDRDLLSVDAYEDLFQYGAQTKKEIRLKGVRNMTDLKDYQKIMENIGVRQMIFQGPPGTSKTFESKRFVLQQLAPSSQVFQQPFVQSADISAALMPYKLTEKDYANPAASPRLATGGWELVQFHPSYGYEDFIRGIEVRTENGAPCYESVNRVLGQIAAFAKLAEQNAQDIPPRFYLIIDEINRANLATVFGELIYGLEYRDSKVATPYEVKDLSDGGKTKDIVLGKNLFFIGTMNTADKSIDAIDYAVRRRFLFIDSPPRREIVRACYQNISGKTDGDSFELLLFDAVQALFDDARFFNDEYEKSDVRLGHTYFLRKKASGFAQDMVERFVFQVVPVLREYVKDGIFTPAQEQLPPEHTPAQLAAQLSMQERVRMLSENLMWYVLEFGSQNQDGRTVNNEYIGAFLDELCGLVYG